MPSPVLFTCIIETPQQVCEVETVTTLFYWCGNQGSEMLRNLSKVTQHRASICTLFCAESEL